MLEYILVRDPLRRPQVSDVIHRFNLLKNQIVPPQDKPWPSKHVVTAQPSSHEDLIAALGCFAPTELERTTAAEEYYDKQPTSVSDAVLIGSLTVAKDLAALHNRGLTHMVNCVSEAIHIGPGLQSCDVSLEGLAQDEFNNTLHTAIVFMRRCEFYSGTVLVVDNNGT